MQILRSSELPFQSTAGAAGWCSEAPPSAGALLSASMGCIAWALSPAGCLHEAHGEVSQSLLAQSKESSSRHMRLLLGSLAVTSTTMHFLTHPVTAGVGWSSHSGRLKNGFSSASSAPAAFICLASTPLPCEQALLHACGLIFSAF